MWCDCPRAFSTGAILNFLYISLWVSSPLSQLGSHLFVSGRRVHEPVDPPALSALLNITPDQQKVLDDIDLQPLAHSECEGSKFYAYAIRVYGFTPIEKLYLRL